MVNPIRHWQEAKVSDYSCARPSYRERFYSIDFSHLEDFDFSRANFLGNSQLSSKRERK